MKSRMSLLLLLLIQLDLMFQTSADTTDAYATDINACLFSAWPSGANTAVLTGTVSCTGAKQSPLCYAVSGANPAQFVSCYNTQTLTPDFTAHVLGKITGSGRDNTWHDDVGSNGGRFPNYSTGNSSYCSRGHYVPNGDFDTQPERNLTFISTNIAPQWQLFNGGNWANVEAAVRAYTARVDHDIYVFTGTGGQATNPTGTVIKLNTKVIAPEYYWKAICDPGVGSIVFVAENNIGDISTTKTAGCNTLSQTESMGIINCYSLTAAGTNSDFSTFKLPSFHVANCKPGTLGTFMNAELTSNLK
ncbi:hypothetical protein QZH41_009244 [Actinostola sp. cb2023]|nr:hypothetical protein QZH41_009244 [Actinostola sp. cb2023]